MKLARAILFKGFGRRVCNVNAIKRGSAPVDVTAFYRSSMHNAHRNEITRLHWKTAPSLIRLASLDREPCSYSWKSPCQIFDPLKYARIKISIWFSSPYLSPPIFGQSPAGLNQPIWIPSHNFQYRVFPPHMANLWTFLIRRRISVIWISRRRL